MMQVLAPLNRSDAFRHLVLTIGSFDGVHLGHRRVLAEVCAQAHALHGTTGLLTFTPHPREFFSPAHAPNLLTSDKTKMRLLEEAGIQVLFLLPFDAQMAAFSPAEFLSEVVVGRCGARSLIVGHDFRFGRNGEGDFALLKELASRFSLATTQVPALVINGERVSSTVIRERLLQGDLEEAEVFLGRKYSLTGEVIRGRGIGQSLGFPTANVRPYHSAIPAHGVYAAEVVLRENRYFAAVNIGIAPTIRNEDIFVEAHIFDFDHELVGSEMEIVFHKRMRPEQRFASRADLITQIEKDVQHIRDWFSSTGLSPQGKSHLS